MPKATSQDLERAVAQLNCSDKGRQAMRDLLAFLENGGISLDDENQSHVHALLSGAWGSYAGTTLELLREIAEPRNEPAPLEAASL